MRLIAMIAIRWASIHKRYLDRGRPSLRHFLCLVGMVFFYGCQPSSCLFEPTICPTVPPYTIERLPSPFTELSTQERNQDWGKELHLGKAFARQQDFYRAITCFKRALILIPGRNDARRMEIEYEIFFAYYVANKYQEAIDAYETSHLPRISGDFPAVRELLMALYDVYMQTEQTCKAYQILDQITLLDQCLAAHLKIETAIVEADFPVITETATSDSAPSGLADFLDMYEINTKSVTKAKFLNAVLPGAGYYYVGQKKTALTSFLINALFIGASYQLYERGYIPAAIILTSLEMGWYFGGINGAGMAANEYNLCLYQRLGSDFLNQNRLFPILMIQKGF